MNIGYVFSFFFSGFFRNEEVRFIGKTKTNRFKLRVVFVTTKKRNVFYFLFLNVKEAIRSVLSKTT